MKIGLNCSIIIFNSFTDISEREEITWTKLNDKNLNEMYLQVLIKKRLPWLKATLSYIIDLFADSDDVINVQAGGGSQNGAYVVECDADFSRVNKA